MSGTVADRNLLLMSVWICVQLTGSACGQTKPELQPATINPSFQPAPKTDRGKDASPATIQLVNADAAIKDETTGEVLEEKHEEVTSQLRVALLQEQVEKAKEDVATRLPRRKRMSRRSTC